jgi:putative ABC transport system substrate-binding protein
MKRRTFIAALGGAAARPLVARAQLPRIPIIGRINMGSANQPDRNREAVLRGLNDTGFFVGRNLSIEYRTTDGQADRLPALIADLVQRNVDLIYGNGAVALAAKAATSTVPIVFVTTVDPVSSGLVASFNHPGGNVTGVVLRAGAETTAKLIELVHEVLPETTTVGMLNDPKFLNINPDTAAVQAAVNSLGLKVIVAEATVEADLEPAMAKLVQAHVGAVLIGDNIYFASLRDQIAQLAMRNKLPMLGDPLFADVGALVSYGASEFDGIRQAGIYMGRILKGEKPADLPVLQPTKFQLVVNLKTAKALGLTVPPSLLARADEVIE